MTKGQAKVFGPSKVDTYHERTVAYLKGQQIAPVTIEMDLTQLCTRSCSGCPYGISRQKGLTLELPFLDKLFSVLGSRTPGIVLSGGEPTVVPHFPQTVAFIGIAKNIMPAAWHTPISARPPLYGVLISPKRHTFDLLEKENGFTVNFLEHNQALLSAQTGSISGKDIAKLEKLGIDYSPADKINGPILAVSYAAYECEKYDVVRYGDHYLCIGRIILMHHRKDILNADRLIDAKKIRPILYFGKDRYITTDPESLAVHKRD